MRFDFTTDIHVLLCLPCRGGFSILNDATSGRQTESIVRTVAADVASRMHSADNTSYQCTANAPPPEYGLNRPKYLIRPTNASAVGLGASEA